MKLEIKNKDIFRQTELFKDVFLSFNLKFHLRSFKGLSALLQIKVFRQNTLCTKEEYCQFNETVDN